MKRTLYRMQIASAVLTLFMFGLINPLIGQGIDTAKVKNASADVLDIAFGKQKQDAVGSAISTIKSTDLDNITVTNVGNALFGKLSGLIVNQRGGEPGNDVPSFMIRGNTSYAGGNGPMIMVDGFQRSIDQLTVEEIATISVLKDAAATAMYGIKGANGVILVTTKRGVIGSKIGVTLKYGMQQPTRLPNFINSANYAALYNEALVNDGRPALYTAGDIQKYSDGTDPNFHPDVNWFNQILEKSSPVMEAGVDFTGGNKVMKYYVLVNFMNNEGLLKNTDWNSGYSTGSSFKRLNFRSNIDIAVTKRLTASLDIGGRMEDRNGPGTAVGTIFDNIYAYAPNLFPAQNPNGTFGGNSAYQGNPLGLLTSTGYSASNDRNFQSSFKLEHELDLLLKGLRIGAVVAFDNWARSTETYKKTFPVFQLSTGASGNMVYTQYAVVSPLTRTAGNSTNNRTNFETYLDYSHTFGSGEIIAKLMYHQDKYIVNFTTGNNTPYLLQGGAARFAYGYKSKYYAELVAGYNGTERFPENKRFGFFPALALSWLLSEENFMKSFTWINHLKARASYGLVGNDNIGAGEDRYLYLSYYVNSGSYPYGDGNASFAATQESNYPNYKITWEKAFKTDLGIEGRLFNCLDFELGYFNEKRTNIVDTRTNELPSILGITAGYVNNGIASRHGIEATIQCTRKVGEFEYTLGINGLITNSNIDRRIEPAYPNAGQYRVGHPVNQFFGLEAIGFLTQADIASPTTPIYTFTQVKPGDVKYKDQDNNGLIDANDEIAIGRSGNPTSYFGINFGIKYKAFSLDGLFQGQGGKDVLINGLSGPMGKKAQISEYVMNRWTSATAETAEFPRLTTADNSNNYRTSNLWLRSADYLRLRSIELAYEIPKSSLSSLKLSSCKIFVQGMNLLTFDKIKNLDPEIFTGYPALQSYNAGVRLQF
ncbi:MAG: SusC/RagA family TonB-linked outer membrane protein [Verrucomicrobiota bacterium]